MPQEKVGRSILMSRKARFFMKSQIICLLGLATLLWTSKILASTAVASVKEAPKITMYKKEQIIAYYQNLNQFQTEIEQERFSPHFEGSVKSTLRLSWHDPKLIFEILSPITLKVTATNDIITVENKGHSEQVSDRLIAGLKAITRFIRNLIRGDSKALSKDFMISFDKNELTATAKKQGALAFIGKIKVLFGQEMAIERIILETGDEKSILKVTSFTTPKASPSMSPTPQHMEPKKP